MKLISHAMDCTVLEARWVGEQELAELRLLLNRALNTLEAKDWPQWAKELDAKLDATIAGAKAQPCKEEYVLIPKQHALVAVSALRQRAGNDAAHAQAPNLYRAEDTEDWAVASAMEGFLKTSRR